MTPIIDIKNKLAVIRNYLLKDLKAEKLVYNYYMLQNKEVFLDIDRLDFHFTKYKQNINIEKLVPIIQLAHSIFFLWNEKFTNEMIVEVDKNFSYSREKNDENFFAFNTSTAFRGVAKNNNGKFLTVFDWGVSKMSEQHEKRRLERIKAIFDKQEIIFQTSVYEIVVDCAKLLNLIQIEYPKIRIDDYEVKSLNDGKFEYEKNFHFNMKKARNGERRETHLKDTPYVKDLFKNNGSNYKKIIKLLEQNKFLSINEDGTLNWKGAIEDSSLADKTLICTLAIILNNKNYFEPNLKNTYISTALTNTFKNINISAKTFGETKANFSAKTHYSKPFYFIN